MLEQARRGELDRWADTPRGRLALIIVLDQFSRSVYKGTPLAYARDPAALRLAQEGIEAGMDRDMEVAERLFFVLPLGHTEDPGLPQRAEWLVRYAEGQVDRAPAHLKPMYEFSLGQARAHRALIARFGCHPHHNTTLDRASARRTGAPAGRSPDPHAPARGSFGLLTVSVQAAIERPLPARR